MNTTRHHRRLRPWIRYTLTIIGGALAALAVICGWSLVLEAVTGINPLSVIRSLIG